MIECLNHKDEKTGREILQVQLLAYQKEADLIGFQDIPPLKETLEQIVQSKEMFIGYREHGKLLGVISYMKKENRIEISRLVVHPAHFKQGIGSALLKHVIQENNDIEVMTGEQNSPAKRLYVKHGFKEIDQVEVEKGFFMSKFIYKAKRLVEVVPYKTEWKQDFSEEKLKLESVFGQNCLNVYHIGSTSIPGMSAKPVIDIMIEVKEISSVDDQNDKMKGLGYEPKGENGIEGRRFFQKGGNNRTHHVQIYETGHPDLERHLLFKEYLIEHPQRAKEYTALKEQLANKYWDQIEHYIAGKDKWIKETDRLALRWKKSREV